MFGAEGLNGTYIVGEWPRYTIQDTIDAAASAGYAVVIPANYKGEDSFINPNNVPLIDLRHTSNRGTGLGGSLASSIGNKIDAGTF